MKQKSAAVKIVPKVTFRVAELDEYFHELHGFLNPDKNRYDWSSGVLRTYPKLKEKLQSVIDIKERERIERAFFEEVEKVERSKMERARDEFQKEWDKISDRIMQALADVLECNWGERDRRVTALLTMNPIMPRYPETRTFHVFYGRGAEDAIDTVIHENLHFIYFEKWKKIFPGIDAEKSGKSNLAWKLSEIVTGVIPNDSRVQSIFEHKFRSYNEFENTKIDGRPLMSYIQELYDGRKDFEDFIRKAWEFVKAHEKEIP